MENASNTVDFSALELALMVPFFISYSVVALVQINNLFSGRFIIFAALSAAAALIAEGFALAV